MDDWVSGQFVENNMEFVEPEMSGRDRSKKTWKEFMRPDMVMFDP